MKTIKLTDAVSPAYKKFFDKFKEINSLEIEKWQAIHILAYICKSYEGYYNLKYTFKFNDVPSKCTEIFRIRQLSQMMSSDPKILKDYVDWVFKYKIIEKKKIITSLGYFTTTDIVNEYKFKFLFKKMEITRATNLPENILKILQEENIKLSTYSDLAFLIKSGDTKYIDIRNKIQKTGFDFTILDRLK